MCSAQCKHQLAPPHVHLLNITVVANHNDRPVLPLPIVKALKPLEEAVGGDLTSLLGDPEQVNDVFSTAVVPDKVLTLADLKDGMSLTTLNGNSVKVTIKQ
jgi:hypothetical protein